MRCNSTNHPCRYWLAILLAASFVFVACGEKKQEQPQSKPEELASVPEKPTATEKSTPKPVADKPEAPTVAPDDPLLGVWEVVDVQGRHAEANTGLVYDFQISGKAMVRGISQGPIPGGRKTGVKKGDLIENEWSWKRLADNEIELRHPDSPGIAHITTTIEGDTMKFEWNKAKGGSIFTMERVK